VLLAMNERGEPALAYSAMAKRHAGETAARVVDRGVRAMGAAGLAEESAMQMLFHDARLQLFSPVSNEMTRNILGEALGLPRSYRVFDVIRSLVLPAADIARLLTLYVDLLGFVPAGQADPHPAWQQLWDLPVCPTRTVHSPKGAVAAHPVRDAGRKQST